jgi:hypothetical protein
LTEPAESIRSNLHWMQSHPGGRGAGQLHADAADEVPIPPSWRWLAVGLSIPDLAARDQPRVLE